MAPRVRVPSAGPTGAEAEFVTRAVSAFRRGSKCLLLSRLESGYWCHRYYAARLAAGFTNRVAVTRYLASQLAPFAEGKRDGDPNSLARFWRVANALGGLSADDLAEGGATLGDGLTLGKIEALSALVIRPEGTEDCLPFSDDPAKQEAAKALWGMACDGKERISTKELAQRVAYLRDPEGEDAEDGGADAVEAATMPPPDEGPNQADQRGTVTGNLLVVAELTGPRDLAELLAGALARNEEPDDVLERLLALLAQDVELCPRSRSACKRALLILRSDDTRHDDDKSAGPSPVQVAAALTGAGRIAGSAPAVATP